MGMKLKVDGKEIPLNEFVEKYLQGTLVGGISTLKGIKRRLEENRFRNHEIGGNPGLPGKLHFCFYLSEEFPFCLAYRADIRRVFPENDITALFAVPHFRSDLDHFLFFFLRLLRVFLRRAWLLWVS